MNRAEARRYVLRCLVAELDSAVERDVAWLRCRYDINGGAETDLDELDVERVKVELKAVRDELLKRSRGTQHG